MGNEFKRKFNALMDEMQLLTETSNSRELEEIKVNLVKYDNSESDCTCRTSAEFENQMWSRAIGKNKGSPYILAAHDELSQEEIEDHYLVAQEQNKVFIIPSIISPNSTLNPNFTSYILFFTIDHKLFMYPLQGTAFSDREFDYN